jgi:DNA-binding SARP family transcriptional activator
VLELRLLGEPALRDAGTGRSVRLWRPHTAVLALLALQPDAAAARDTLAGLIWSESSPSAARRALRQTVHRLGLATAGLLQAGGERVGLRLDRVTVDVRRFREHFEAGRLEEAIGLYGGDFLEGFALPGSAPLDTWVSTQRERLKSRAVEVLKRLAEDAAASGRWDRGVAYAHRWSELAPWSEEAISYLMRLLARRGDGSEALAKYVAFAARLEADLQARPGEALEDLAQRIRRGRPPDLGPPHPAGAAAEPGMPFVGREEELARLATSWRLARSGRRQVVLVSGGAGVGKSRLLAEFAESTRLEGATVLSGRALESGRHLPYAVLADALRGAGDAPGGSAASPSALREVERIVPGLRTRSTATNESPSRDDPEGGRLRLLEGLRELVEALAFESPVLLLLDDLPWVDEATRDGLLYLVRTLPSAPWLLAATARTGGADSAARVLAEVRRAAGETCHDIHLAPLPRGAVARLAVLMRGAVSEADLDSLARATGGNPLFLSQLLRKTAEEFSGLRPESTLGEVIAARLDRLTQAARSLLQALAVLGRHAPLSTAAEVANLDLGDALQAVAELTASRLIGPEGSDYDVHHELFRSATLGTLSEEAGADLHRRAFQRLARDAGEDVSLGLAAEIAEHAIRGRLVPEAYRWNLRAAALAERVYAVDEAERRLRQALDLASTAEEEFAAWVRLGDLRRVASRFLEAALAYRNAKERTCPGDPARLELRARLLDASLAAGMVRLSEARGVLEELLEHTRHADPAAHRDLLLVAARASLREQDPSWAVDYAEAALACARGIADPAPLTRALLVRARAESTARPDEPVLRWLEEAVRVAERADLAAELADARVELATELCRLGRWDEASSGWQEILESGSAAGLYGAVTVASLNAADLFIRRGAWDHAEQNLRRAEDLAARFDFPHVRVGARINRVLMAWARGDSGVSTLASAAAHEAAGTSLPGAERTARALAVLAAPDPAASELEEDFEALQRLASARHWTWSDDRELAAAARARRIRSAGDPQRALEILEEARAGAADPHARAFLAVELAGCLREIDPRRAAELLSEAIATARDLGARPLEARARAGLEGSA